MFIILLYSLVRDLPQLRVSLIGCVPQRERRPRMINDYTFIASILKHSIWNSPMQYSEDAQCTAFYGISKVLIIVMVWFYSRRPTYLADFTSSTSRHWETSVSQHHLRTYQGRIHSSSSLLDSLWSDLLMRSTAVLVTAEKYGGDSAHFIISD